MSDKKSVPVSVHRSRCLPISLLPHGREFKMDCDSPFPGLLFDSVCFTAAGFPVFTLYGQELRLTLLKNISAVCVENHLCEVGQ